MNGTKHDTEKPRPNLVFDAMALALLLLSRKSFVTNAYIRTTLLQQTN